MLSPTTNRLLFLNTTPPVLLRILNGSLVTLDLTLVQEAVRGLEWACEVTSSGFSKDVDLDQIRFQSTLEGDDRLNQKRVGVLEVQVHHAHHTNTHQLSLEQLAQLPLVVLHVGGSYRTGLLVATERSGLHVLQRSHI